MSSNGITAGAFLKNAFYKGCFCLGLGTASYYSFAEVHFWLNPAPEASRTNVVSAIQEKVNVLQAAPALQPSVHVDAHPGLIAVSQAAHEGYRAQPNAYLNLIEKPAAKAESPVIPANEVAAAPSPAASPGSVPATGEATADKKESKPEGENANPEGVSGGVPAASLASAAPVAQDGAYAYAVANSGMYAGAGQGATEPQAQGDTAAPASVGLSANGQSSNTASGNGSGPGMASTGNLSPNNNLNSGMNPIYPSYAGGPGVTASGSIAANNAASFLSQKDLTLLLSPIKASFVDTALDISGLVCTLNGQGNAAPSCSKTNHYTVHSSRWNTREGLSNEAAFMVKSTSGSNQLEVSFNFKLQNSDQNYQTVTGAASPTEVLVHSEVRSGKNFRVFELKLPNLTLRGNEPVKNLTATLVYEVTPTGSSLSADSKLSFTRSHFQTSGSAWDLTDPNRGPAANDQQIIVADEVPYSMKLEKSQ